MKPSNEYLEQIARKLDAMNRNDPGIGRNSEGCNEPFKMPSFIDQVGITAMEYLKNKKDPEIMKDPLFMDRN
jgi:hypothetical protein